MSINLYLMKLFRVFFARLFLASIILPQSFLTASAQGFAWAQAIVSSSSSGNPAVYTVTTDANNNGYIVGTFSGTADFGGQTLTAVADFDMFILKKNAAGNLLWVKQIEGIDNNSSMCTGRGIQVDGAGNVYIAGFFTDSFDFDPGPGVYPLYSDWAGYSFILKLNASGDFIWVKDMGSPTNDAGISIQSMKMDAAANIFFACNYAGNPLATLDVDPGPGVYNIVCPGSTGYDILIEKLDSAGNFIWAKEITGPSDQSMPAMALDAVSNIYLTGRLSSMADFDPGPGVANLLSVDDYDVFVAKYDSNGTYQWAGQIGGGNNQVGYDISADTFGGVVLTGYFENTADFDPGVGVYNMTTAVRDIFVLKLRSDGSFAWANSAHPGANDGAVGIATDWQGNIYTTGAFFTSADFDPGPQTYVLSGVAYVQKLDSAGQFAWARAFGGQYPLAITLDQADDIYVVGWLQTGGDFDPGPGVFNIPGGHVGFIEKLCGSSLAISADDSTLCVGDQAQLTTPAITGATYTWTMDGTVIAGSSNTITISTPGVYEVYVTGGCPIASGPLYVYDCLGVGETMKADGIVVYPNPAQDQLTIKTTLTNYTITILNTLGQVTEKIAGSRSAVLDISQYNSGIYYLRLETADGQVWSRKFVVGD